MRPSETASEGSWEHPSQPINTRKDPQGSREGEETGPDFPLKQLEEKAEAQGQCSTEPAGMEATLRRPASKILLHREPEWPRDRMAGCSALWPGEDVRHWYPHRGNPRMAVSEEDQRYSRRNCSAEIPESFKQRLSFCSLPTSRAKPKTDSEEYLLLDARSFFWS